MKHWSKLNPLPSGDESEILDLEPAGISAHARPESPGEPSEEVSFYIRSSDESLPHQRPGPGLAEALLAFVDSITGAPVLAGHGQVAGHDG